jgi:hypothetical protein
MVNQYVADPNQCYELYEPYYGYTFSPTESKRIAVYKLTPPFRIE